MKCYNNLNNIINTFDKELGFLCLPYLFYFYFTRKVLIQKICYLNYIYFIYCITILCFSSN